MMLKSPSTCLGFYIPGCLLLGGFILHFLQLHQTVFHLSLSSLLLPGVMVWIRTKPVWTTVAGSTQSTTPRQSRNYSCYSNAWPCPVDLNCYLSEHENILLLIFHTVKTAQIPNSKYGSVYFLPFQTDIPKIVYFIHINFLSCRAFAAGSSLAFPHHLTFLPQIPSFFLPSIHFLCGTDKLLHWSSIRLDCHSLKNTQTLLLKSKRSDECGAI